MDKFSLLSIVIPVYRQEKTIVDNVKNLEKALDEINIKYEVIVVIDGLLDKASEELRKIKNKNLRIYGYKNNQGKGYAVKYGMLKAKGDIVGFVDAGMDIDLGGIRILLDYLKLHNADIVVGSKLHPDSEVVYPTQRKIMSWGYRTFTHLLFGFNIRDTQVGLKLFKRKVARDVFIKLLVKQFSFDVETLAVAYLLGYKEIYEAPIKLKFNNNSSITSRSFWRIICHMLWDTIGIFYRLKIIKYYNNKDKEKI